MLGLHVTVPVACFRKGMAREYLETEHLPPPATCYGFLLSLVGETNRRRHVGARVSAGLLSQPERSVVLRTVWRVKKATLGASGNTRPDYQQLLSHVNLVMWLDSGEEKDPSPNLEERVSIALDPARRHEISRFGGLSLGESTHMVDEVSKLTPALCERLPKECRLFLLAERGRISLPVWVDHVGSAGTVHNVGNLVTMDLSPPQAQCLPRILSPMDGH
jgi:CRISPR-associated protein Cas5t